MVIENYQHGPRMAFAFHSFKNQLCALFCHKVFISIPHVVRRSQTSPYLTPPPQELSADLCILPWFLRTHLLFWVYLTSEKGLQRPRTPTEGARIQVGHPLLDPSSSCLQHSSSC